MVELSLPGIEQARAAGRLALTEPEAKDLLSQLGIAVPRGGIVAQPSEAADLAAHLGGPVVVKIVSPDLTHKSDIGGVRVGLATPQAAREAATEILENVQRARPEARIDGMLVEEQLRGGVECVAGVLGHSALGPAVMFGLGGVFVEIFNDVVFRLAPLHESDAREMLDGLQASRLLTGYRGAPPADRDALIRILLSLGDLAASGAIAELDINPLLALPDRAVALDAVVTLNPPDVQRLEPRNG
jgi:succinyl-CoA synthetase beta subunit